MNKYHNSFDNIVQDKEMLEMLDLVPDKLRTTSEDLDNIFELVTREDSKRYGKLDYNLMTEYYKCPNCKTQHKIYCKDNWGHEINEVNYCAHCGQKITL